MERMGGGEGKKGSCKEDPCVIVLEDVLLLQSIFSIKGTGRFFFFYYFFPRDKGKIYHFCQPARPDTIATPKKKIHILHKR